MACFNPVGGWIGQEPNPSGRFPVVFRLRDGWADRPVDLPCGKCIGCLQDRARGWSVRCFHESTLHERNAFATLTYREEVVPDRVDKSHLQKFFKRLRQHMKFRYFACGEYGGRFGRPHYHVLFFGQDFLEGSQRLGTDGEYYTHRLLDEVWGNGHVTVAPCEPASVFYVAGYQLKNLGGPDDVFQLQSRRPYIGAGWLERYHDDIVRNGFVTIDGRKMPIPTAYLLRPEFALEFDALKEARRVHVESMTPEERWERRRSIRSREKNLAARVRHKSTASSK